MQQESILHMTCRIRYARLNTLFLDQGEIETPGGITITKITLRGDDSLLYADVAVQGLYTGLATLQCVPGYDVAARKFTVSDVDIKLVDDNMFAKFAGKMLNNLLGDKLDTKIEELINAKFQEVLHDILGQLRAIDLPKGGTLNFDTKNWQLSDLSTNAEGLSVKASLTGVAQLEY